jgi:malonyl-CoA/methylmalonyl-CoA synthetase
MEGGGLRDFISKGARRQGAKRAFRFMRGLREETALSYLEMDRDANRMANVLTSRGLKRGDRIILFMPKSVAMVIAHVAVQKIGAVSVPLNPGFTPSEVAYLTSDAAPGMVIAGCEQTVMLGQITPELPVLTIDTERPYQELGFFRSASDRSPNPDIRPEDPGLIVYTSGTTGRPKGAVLTQRNLVQDALNVIEIWEIRENDTLCHALPLFHIHGLCFALHTGLMAGARVIMLDRFSPETALRVLKDKRTDISCTLFMAVPTMYRKMIGHLGVRKLDFGHIRLWASGSAPLLPKDFERIARVFGKEPVEREGMSETGMNFSNPLTGPRKPGSIGLPLPQLEVRITDPVSLEEVAPGHTGEIWLKGPAVTPGYWRKPRETAEAFENGWFRTGDLGRMDEEGYYYLTDRMKHIIVSGGENISPKEVEMVINQLDDVVESCVVGLPDAEWGERVVATVSRKAGSRLTSDDVKTHCKRHLHPWKCPKEVLFPNELPKNRMGKVLKDDVKKMFQGRV